MKYYIYKYENLINGKTYVGQTNNIRLRRNGHRSTMNNPNDKGYNHPFYRALRKYGVENFSFEVLEEIEDDEKREKVTEKEIYFQHLYHSFIGDGGYCLQEGQLHNKFKEPLSFEEKCGLSKLFSLEEIKDIQKMLIQGYQFFEVQEKYPTLSDSFISNINTGINFKREDLSYPLLKKHSKSSLEQQNKIIEEIKNGISYSTISNKYDVSIGLLSQINSGEHWFREGEKYPLCKKLCADKEFKYKCVYDILFSSLTYREIGEKYGRTRSAIKAIAAGRNSHFPELKYGLRENKEENQDIWKKLFKQYCNDYPLLEVE